MSQGGAFVHNLIAGNMVWQEKFAVDDKGAEVFVSFNLKDFDNFKTTTLATALLGKAKMPRAAYENPDGSPLVPNRDYLGNRRASTPAPGPFENAVNGKNRFKVR
jgi:hypothetical protein